MWWSLLFLLNHYWIRFWFQFCRWFQQCAHCWQFLYYYHSKYVNVTVTSAKNNSMFWQRFVSSLGPTWIVAALASRKSFESMYMWDHNQVNFSSTSVWACKISMFFAFQFLASSLLCCCFQRRRFNARTENVFNFQVCSLFISCWWISTWVRKVQAYLHFVASGRNDEYDS